MSPFCSKLSRLWPIKVTNRRGILLKMWADRELHCLCSFSNLTLRKRQLKAYNKAVLKGMHLFMFERVYSKRSNVISLVVLSAFIVELILGLHTVHAQSA